MDPTSILAEAENRLNARPEALEGMDAVYGLNLSGERGGHFYLEIKDKKATLLKVPPTPTPNATVRLSDEDFVRLAEQKTSGMTLFMEGKIQIEGDLGVAMRLEGLLKG